MMNTEDTLILSHLETKVVSRAAFRGFLLRYGLTIQQVARAAKVPQLTIWSIDRGNPVRASYEQPVRMGLYRLTGVAYTAPIAVVMLREHGRKNAGEGAQHGQA
ncbi:MAG: hypothetical protein ABI406_04965 [Ktedonobacteraceae bacterium]